MIRHLIWETDGVLFDTHPAVTFAICQSLNEMGYTVALNVVDDLARKSLDFCVETLAARYKLDPSLLRQRSAEYYIQIPPERQQLFAGAREVCAWAAAHGGLNLIAAARSVNSTRALLAAHGLTSLFAGIFSAEQGFPCKPDPSILLAALKQHALDPAETLLIGRREIDIQAGQAAGIRTGLFGPAEVSTPPSLRLKDYAALLAYLKGSLLEKQP